MQRTGVFVMKVKIISTNTEAVVPTSIKGEDMPMELACRVKQLFT